VASDRSNLYESQKKDQSRLSDRLFLPAGLDLTRSEVQVAELNYKQAGLMPALPAII